MKYAAFIFLIFAGGLKAEIPAGATDLIPRKDSSPAIERLQIKDETVTTITYSEITITSIEVPSVFISKDPKSEKKK